VQLCIARAACKDEPDGRLQVGIVQVDLEGANAMRAIQATISSTAATAALTRRSKSIAQKDRGGLATHNLRHPKRRLA
jgi:hypothetical protein